MVGLVRSYAWKLGLRVKGDTGRPSFEKIDHFRSKLAHEMWKKVMHARNGGGPYKTRQEWSVVEGIVNEYGPKIWGYSERPHLLRAGERDEYPEDLYWEKHTK